MDAPNTFAMSAAKAEKDRQPVARGITAKGGDVTLLQQTLEEALPGEWSFKKSQTGWTDATTTAAVDLGRTWEVARKLLAQGFTHAEPLLLVRVPGEHESPTNPRMEVWGAPYSRDTIEDLEDASKNPQWLLDRMNVPAAHECWRKKQKGEPGEGILVAHPDTGYTNHPQLRKVWQLPGFNFIEDHDDRNAADTLTTVGLLQNPGHGTATGSVIASRIGDNENEKDVHGVAPGARILPMRVSTSVVHFDFRNVSRALEEAVASRAHVVSMSLGGPRSSQRLRDAVNFALDHGVIVVSAAGNMLPNVMFPAAIPGVVAMAASNALNMAWRLSGFGEEVVATAPGEFVWNCRAFPNGTYGADRGTGTSFATAATAGVAALWLSYHGRDNLLAIFGEAKLIPFAFHRLLCATAIKDFEFIRGGNGGFGAGIVNAEALLEAALPTREEVEKYRKEILSRANLEWTNLTLRELWMLARVPTSPDRRGLAMSRLAEKPVREEHVRAYFEALIDSPKEDAALLDEVAGLIHGTPNLRARLPRALELYRDGAREARALAILRESLLAMSISPELRAALERAAEKASSVNLSPQAMWEVAATIRREKRPEAASPYPKPLHRRLRAFAFDPSLALTMKTKPISEVTIKIPWETLKPGPIGEYVEIIDVDPATDCVYIPVDLDDPHLLASDGHAPSLGNPEFHQQMAYAVAMKTISTFESALGRPIFWSALRPWHDDLDRANAAPRSRPDGSPDLSDQYVAKLRIYPHALRERNAYYSPIKRALLFGYFPATEDDPGEVYPGGLVFTCLSHDVVAHETTHALLDGMHVYFNEPTNPDVFGFHEGFADIVALFQHFSYPEILFNQIAQTRGQLSSQNLLVELAQEFGKSGGGHQALRGAIGALRTTKTSGVSVGPAGAYKRDEKQYSWERYRPDANLLNDSGYVGEAHARGSILVAAVFDAFLAIYESRVADLIRIASGGTGVLPDGNLHPDLVARMCQEAGKSAEHVLRMCVRALDYTPPVDITFGEFLRALITADMDLVPNDDRGYRTAFIESFRSWGIYPRDIRVLSEETLAWHREESAGLLADKDEFDDLTEKQKQWQQGARTQLESIRRTLSTWKPGSTGERGRPSREEIFCQLADGQQWLSNYISEIGQKPNSKRLLALLDVLKVTFHSEDHPWLPRRRLSVANLRPATRVGPHGEHITEMVCEIVRSVDLSVNPDEEESPTLEFRGGVTLIVNMEDWTVSYAIVKRIGSESRAKRQRLYRTSTTAFAAGAAEYKCTSYEGDTNVDRVTNLEAMRASSCKCNDEKREKAKKRKKKKADNFRMDEPFAMLHRGVEFSEEV